MMKGITLLAKNENMPPPFLLLGETVWCLGWNTLISDNPPPLWRGVDRNNVLKSSSDGGMNTIHMMFMLRMVKPY